MAQQRYASGKYTKGLCDRCGFAYKLNELKSETVQGKDQHNRVCPKCWDPDHPQNFLPIAMRMHGEDAEAVKDPRPDVFPIAYPVLLKPNTITHGTTVKVMATGVFSGYSVTMNSPDSGITINNPTLLTPTSISISITVASNVDPDTYILTVTDVSGTQKRAQLTVN